MGELVRFRPRRNSLSTIQPCFVRISWKDTIPQGLWKTGIRYHDPDTKRKLRILGLSHYAFDCRILLRDHHTPAKHQFCVFAARNGHVRVLWLRRRNCRRFGCVQITTGGNCQLRHRFQLQKRLVQSLLTWDLPSPLNTWLFLDRNVISFILSSSISLPLSRFNDALYLSLYDSTFVSRVRQRINTSEEDLILATIYGGSGSLGKVFANRGILGAPKPFTLKAATWIKYVVSASRCVKTRTWEERKNTKF